MLTLEVVLKFLLITVLPAVLTVLLDKAQKNCHFFAKCNRELKTLIIGVLFGLCAICGTEFGIITGGAIINTRDAAVICAGLFFGGPSAVIAAVIGAGERFITSTGGSGELTKWACSIATLCAGIITPLLRNFFFRKKRPNWHQCFAVGVFIEVIHLLLVITINISEIQRAMRVIKAVSVLLICINGLAVMLATFFISFVEKTPIFKTSRKELTSQFNLGIFIAMLLGFFISIFLTFVMEESVFRFETERTLDVAIADVEEEVKFAGNRTDDSKINILVGIIKTRHLYKTGSIVLLDENKTIIYDKYGNEGKNLEEADIELTSTENHLFFFTMNNEEFVYKYKTIDKYMIVALAPVEEARVSGELAVYIVFFMEMIVFAIIFINVFILIKLLILRNLEKINEDLKKITDGNLDVVLDVKTSKEFETLSGGINSTVERLKKLIEFEKTRIDAELEVARQIQASSVPTVFPKHPTGAIYALMDPAKEVGGDFYDFFFIQPHYLYLLIADVSGKGIPAALFMMKAKTLIRNLVKQTDPGDTGRVLTMANEILCESNNVEMFVTCWMGCLNTSTGHVTFSNAGHNRPIIRKQGCKPVFLNEKTNFVLAGMEGSKYLTQEFDMGSGDLLYLYTDGITEATNANNELFGDSRLLQIFENVSNEPEDVCKVVKEAADRFTGDAPQFDDMTELALRLN